MLAFLGSLYGRGWRREVGDDERTHGGREGRKKEEKKQGEGVDRELTLFR